MAEPRAPAPPPPLTADEVKRIAIDYSLGRPAVGYTPEMLACRDRIHSEYLAFKKLHPNATLEVFGDVEGLPDPER